MRIIVTNWWQVVFGVMIASVYVIIAIRVFVDWSRKRKTVRPTVQRALTRLLLNVCGQGEDFKIIGPWQQHRHRWGWDRRMLIEQGVRAHQLYLASVGGRYYAYDEANDRLYRIGNLSLTAAERTAIKGLLSTYPVLSGCSWELKTSDRLDHRIDLFKAQAVYRPNETTVVTIDFTVDVTEGVVECQDWKIEMQRPESTIALSTAEVADSEAVAAVVIDPVAEAMRD